LSEQNMTTTSKPWLNALFAVLLLSSLYLSKLYSYLLFHGLSELFSIIIACGIFMLVWNTRRFFTNNYFLFIGIAFLFIGFIDTVHTFAYKGMGIFKGYDSNLPTQLWIAARYVQSITFLVAPLFTIRKLKVGQAFAVYLAASFLLLFAIFYRIFPDCFIEGQGLTAFKVTSEYIISAILAVSLAFLYRKRTYFDPYILKLLAASTITVIASEMSFTLYADVYGFFNMLGHVLKIVAFYLIYRAMIVTGLDRPYGMLFRDLKIERDRAQQYLDLARVMFVAIDADQKVTLINRRGCEVLGYDEHEIVGKNWFDTFLPERLRDTVRADFFRLMAGEVEAIAFYENPVLTKAGDERLIAWHNTVFFDENGHVTGTLGSGEDITDRKRLEKALMESEERFRHLYNNAEVGLFRTRISDGVPLQINQRYAELAGYATIEECLEDFVAADHYADPEARQRILEAVTQTGEVANYEAEIIRKDNKHFWVDLSARVYPEDGYIEGALVDITDKKNAESKLISSLKEKETLLKEIHHRVKNNLQVISSLLDLQSSYLHDEKAREMLHNSMDRIKTMARIHTMLYQSEDMSRVDLGGFIRDLAARLQQSHGTGRSPVAINVNVPDISLTIETSIPCGLILNELVSNALKHAFPEGRGGEIDIGMKVEGDQFVLTVRDNGTGFPAGVDFHNTKTLGLELVNLLTGQIDGTATMTVGEGTTFTVIFPAATKGV